MSTDFAQLVKQQADIVRIIGDYLKLRKTGAQNYTGLCPFHKEKTGSFSVNATHGYYYCFGCHEKGDVFNFVMKMESLSFPEAVRAVAVKAGIPLPKREFNSPEEAREAGLRRQLLDIHEAATQYFEAQLKSPEAARAREYLTSRGVTPGDRQDLPHRLRARRLQPHARSPRARTSRKKSSAPAACSAQKTNPTARPAACTPASASASPSPSPTKPARSSPSPPARSTPTRKNAKYLNSPETALYTKGQILFNLDKAKSQMRKERLRHPGRRPDGLHLRLHGRNS